jgi:hypothetical protein
LLLGQLEALSTDNESINIVRYGVSSNSSVEEKRQVEVEGLLNGMELEFVKAVTQLLAKPPTKVVQYKYIWVY